MINKKAIMRRIYVIWFARKIMSPRSVKAGVLALFAWQFTTYVSVGDVFVNAPLKAGLSTNFYFLESAFQNTEFITIALLAGIALAGFFFVREFLPRRQVMRPKFVRI